ncbi:hypothetical protein EEA47_22090 [Vibrio alginolyticus]|nr:hypothetical protein EEA47_22090 [Vibrio alginolyticus]
MTNKRCPKGSAKIVLCFVKEYLLRMLGYNSLPRLKRFYLEQNLISKDKQTLLCTEKKREEIK